MRHDVPVSTGVGSSIDVLYVTALEEDEGRPARAVAQGPFLGHPGVAHWTPCDEANATPYERGEFVLADGTTFSVAFVSQARMGGDSAARTLATLIERLNPHCLAMSGVCAGRPGFSAYGDVLVAETAYFADEGKHTKTGFRPDIRAHSMPVRWVRRARTLDSSNLPSFALPTVEQAIDWFLVSLMEGRDPRDQPERKMYVGPDWKGAVAGLVAHGLILRSDNQVVLTPAGLSRAQQYIYDNPEAPPAMPFSIRVGPMTSKPYVDASDPWDVLTTSGVRTVVGLEMESAAVAASAYELDVDHWIVAKGVMDNASATKGDHYKEFAARASAEVVWKFLIDRRLTEPTSICHGVDEVMEPRALRRDRAGEGDPKATLPASNLGRSENLFVDRVVPRAQCIEALHNGTRLVTVHGPSGSGKSRLATEVANDVRADFADHVYVVDLSVVADPDLVLTKIIDVLQVQPSDPLIDALREVFRGTPVLLILENFERVADAAGRVRDLLDIAPDLKIIVTSELPIGLAGELRVAAEELLPKDGANLFLARAQRVVTTTEELAQVERLCTVLREPLAIELAADQARTSPLGELSRVLESPAFLDLKNRVQDAPQRHQTLASAVAWSLECLDPVERSIFVRLSVFEGPWTHEAAEAVVAPLVAGRPAFQWMSRLLEGRFVLNDLNPGADARDESRYTMLFAMRAFGRRQLAEDPGAHREVRAAYAKFYRELVKSYAEPIVGPDRLELCKELSRDHTNIHAALDFFVEVRDVVSALQMAAVLDTYWWSRSYSEGYVRLKAVLGLGLPAVISADDRLRRGKVLVAAGKLGLRQCDLDQAATFFNEARHVAQIEDSPGLEAVALERGALVDLERTRYHLAQASLTTALGIFTRLGDEGLEGRADCLNDLGTVGCELDDNLVEQYFQEALEIYAAVAGAQASAWVRTDEAQAAYLRGDLLMARVHAEYVQSVGRQHDEPGLLTWSGNILGHVAAAEDDLRTARQFFNESLTLAALQGNLRPRLRALEGFVVVASRTGKHESALCLLAAVEHVRKRRSLPRAITELRLIEGSVERSRAGLSVADQTRSKDRGSLMSLLVATEFARSV